MINFSSRFSAGKHVRRGTIRKIVGLDPAGVLFRYANVAGRLAEGDARYVEIIHTAAGSLGFSSPLGTASFYPNGGRSQPGCGWDLAGHCAHSRAFFFFAESLYTDTGFYAYQCESLRDVRRGRCHVLDGIVKLGGEPGNLHAAKGIYFLRTNRASPFAKGFFIA